MKFLMIAAMSFVASTSSFASSLLCNGVDGYEISFNTPVNEWHDITIKKNGSILLSGLRDNVDYVLKDSVTGEYNWVYRGVSVNDGIISSIILAISHNQNVSSTVDSGIGNAVITVGGSITEVKGLSCTFGF
jgi:hypothetical protein